MIKFSFILLSLIFAIQVNSQDALRFKKEIENFKAADATTDYQDVLLFTGSSSVRFWKSLKEDYPNHNVLNRGFGGSHFSDLIYHADQLILQYLPKKIFVYEGDNDLAAGKDIEEILADAETLITKIRRTLPNSDIYFIAPKPSVSRWHLKELYLDLNNRITARTASDPKLHFIDVWTPMCDTDGEVFKDIFIGDNLHMNKKGYAIWKEVVEPYVMK